jgi:stress-induced morphogen
MYRVEVISKKFNGKSVLEQHRMVNEVLKGDIAKMHGLTVKTKAANAE